MNNNTGTVFIVDDDKSVRRSLSLFFKSANFNVETFSSAEEYLSSAPYNGIGCIILDVNMGATSGLELQDELNIKGSHLPIIFITGIGNVPMSVNTLKKGAVNFLEKPFEQDELLKSVYEAIELSKNLKAEKEEKENACALINSLTTREHDILGYLLTGMLNKQIAYELNITEHTVKIHRGKICEKLGVKSVPEIIYIAEKAEISPPLKNPKQFKSP